jgi:hypothetical protein
VLVFGLFVQESLFEWKLVELCAEVSMNNVFDSRTCIEVEVEFELGADGDGRDVILLERLADVYDAGF